MKKTFPEKLNAWFKKVCKAHPKYKKLYHGDMVIMVSDGVLDFEAMPEIPFTMEMILEKIETKNAQTFADRLMEAIPVPVDGHDDDRTVLVAAVWEKGHDYVGKD